MRQILTFALLLAGLSYLSSCQKKDDVNTNLLQEPSADSVSKGSYFRVSFNDPQHPNDTTEQFLINDLTRNNQAVYSLTSNTDMRPPDSVYLLKIELTDHNSQQINVHLSLINDSTKSLIGNYYVKDNQSLFTDYTRGENKTYAIKSGSVVNVTHDGDDCITGTFTLHLYYDHKTSDATGSFKIFH